MTVTMLALAIASSGTALGGTETPFAPNVDVRTGALHVPENYTEWPTLGTWAHANTDELQEKDRAWIARVSCRLYPAGNDYVLSEARSVS